MPASWRALPEIDGACVIRIDEALECARLLVEGYLLIVPLRPDARGRYRVHGDEVAVAAGRTQLREPGDVQRTLDRRSTSVRVLWLPVAYVEAVARALGRPAARRTGAGSRSTTPRCSPPSTSSTPASRVEVARTSRWRCASS